MLVIAPKLRVHHLFKDEREVPALRLWAVQGGKAHLPDLERS